MGLCLQHGLIMWLHGMTQMRPCGFMVDMLMVAPCKQSRHAALKLLKQFQMNKDSTKSSNLIAMASNLPAVTSNQI